MRIGIVGGGQLGRMMALAAQSLGHTCTVLDHAADATAGTVAALIVGEFDDESALERLAAACDAVTFDFENVPAASAEFLAERVRVLPPPMALRLAQDRLAEKRLFNELGIPTPAFAPVDDLVTLTAALDSVGLPAVLKTRRLGYDGKGQRVVRTPAEAESAAATLGACLIVESLVAFERELSVVAVRDQGGGVACYPLVENTHRDGILHTSIAPADPSAHSARAADFVTRLLDRLGYVGVIALELFDCSDGLLANEYAPRVHNSGHWTIEGAVTSQFENHLRAIAGDALGRVDARGHAAMVNFIGAMPLADEVATIPGAHLHDYAKAARPGRKLGHATIVAPTRDALEPSLESLVALADRVRR